MHPDFTVPSAGPQAPVIPTIAVAHVLSAAAPVHAAGCVPWPDLVRLVSAHTVGPKEGPGWLAADVDPGPRQAARVRGYGALVLDIEAATSAPGADGLRRVLGPLPPSIDDVAALLAAPFGLAAAIASTHSHEAPAADGGTLGPRYRVVIPLSRPVLAHELRALGLHLAAVLGLNNCFDP